MLFHYYSTPRILPSRPDGVEEIEDGCVSEFGVEPEWIIAEAD